MSLKGIDISSWQGNLTSNNWLKIKNDDIEFAILRCGFTGYGVTKSKNIDRYFENNYKMAKELNIPVGCYYYSCATTIDEAKEEANYVLSIIKDKQFEYPIYYDVEDNHDITNPNYSSSNQVTIGKNLLTEIVKTFCEILENSGYYVGIYASTYWFNNYLNLNDLNLFDKWVAQWSSNEPLIDCGMWQYTSSGVVNGISGNVDLNYAYYDFPSIIKSLGLNNFEKTIIDSSDESELESDLETDAPLDNQTNNTENVPDVTITPTEKNENVINCLGILFAFVKKIIVNLIDLILKR